MYISLHEFTGTACMQKPEDPLKLELQAVASHLIQVRGTDLEFSAGTACYTLSMSEHLSGPIVTCT